MLGELFQADLETWKQFLTDRWYVLVIALIALLSSSRSSKPS